MATTETKKICSLRFDHRPDYLFVSITGESGDLDVRRRLWVRIAAEFKNKRYTKLLVEENIAEPLPMVDVFQLAAELPKMGFTGAKSAYVDANSDNADQAQFGQTVAANRGLNCAVFNNIPAAEAWLLKK